VLFYIGAMGKFDPALLTSITPDPGQSAMFPKGTSGILAAIPYAIWFYLGIELVPHAAEETREPSKNIPKGMIIGMFTLIILAFSVLFFNSGIAPGPTAIGTSSAPLADGFKTIFGEGTLATSINLLSLSGFVGTFFFIIFASARVLFSLSRAGYFPEWISLTGENRTPGLALILGGVIGLQCTAIIGLAGQYIAAILLNMSVFAALIAYFMVMISYIKLKISRPDLPRPYKSPLGILGAFTAAVLSLVAIVACFLDAAYRPGVIGVAVSMGLMLGYFVMFSRKNLVAQAPEEASSLAADSLKPSFEPGT
jgi:ethanolamine permease